MNEIGIVLIGGFCFGVVTLMIIMLSQRFKYSSRIFEEKEKCQ